MLIRAGFFLIYEKEIPNFRSIGALPNPWIISEEYPDIAIRIVNGNQKSGAAEERSCVTLVVPRTHFSGL